jgi:2-phospho-L-lactate/phosphoenolpyruvate guanylyltransferase
MQKWTALVPLGDVTTGKSRLSSVLNVSERACISAVMARHVVETLLNAKSIGRVMMVSDAPLAGTFGIPDKGRGLNLELESARQAIKGPLLITHSDLPLLSVEDIEAICSVGLKTIVLNFDRHGSGTNAIALGNGAAFDLKFGVGSAAAHSQQLGGNGVVIDRPGFALDVDTGEDLAYAEANGFVWRS